MRTAALACALLPVLGCGSSNNGGNPATNFQSFDVAALASKIAPVFHPQQAGGANLPLGSLTYNSDSDWPMAEQYLSEILGDPDQDPKVVTKMMILIRMAQSTLADATQAAYGAQNSCTPVPSGMAIGLPWYDDHQETPFWGMPDPTGFDCAGANQNGGWTLVGRRPIASPPATCTDPYTYQFMLGGQNTTVNMEDVAHRGAMVTITMVFFGTYDRCSDDLSLAFAHLTEYSAGAKFGSRSELSGNATTHQFSLRSGKYDKGQNTDQTWYERNTLSTSHGTSQAATGAEHFIISLQTPQPNNPSPPTEYFCMATPSTMGGDYTPSPGDGCAMYETDYSALVPFTPMQVPTVGWSNPSPVSISLDMAGSGSPTDGGLGD